MTVNGDANHVDYHTRKNMIGIDTDVQWAKFFAVGWFIVGMIVGSALHDYAFHAIEQVMK